METITEYHIKDLAQMYAEIFFDDYNEGEIYPDESWIQDWLNGVWTVESRRIVFEGGRFGDHADIMKQLFKDEFKSKLNKLIKDFQE